MTNITLSIPPELKKEMEKFPEINWSEVARTSIKQKIVELNFLKELTLESEITPEEAVQMGREVNLLLAKRYKVEKE
ncbi:MAG: hypothetical protein EU542_06320 [Promethearchaeota archaeon]|nr:MAG: hypothetical protein EU542_06320 [Candidatus Lokiarchaeota archaeon]